MTEQVGGIDPQVSSNLWSQWVFEHIYDQLLRRDRNGMPIPGLAESWNQPNPTTHEFKLRRGVKWHHGREFVADDVKFSIERQMDPEVGGMNQAIYGPNVQSVDVIDNYTVRISLKQVFAPFLNYLAAPRAGNIVALDFTKEAGDLKTRASGTGPFKFVEYVSGSHTKLVRNPDYWEPNKPLVDELMLRYMADEQTRIAALRANQVDMSAIAATEIAALQSSDPNLQVFSTRPLVTQQMMINNAREPLTDRRVRQAISYAIDRQEMMETVTLGLGAISTYLPPGDEFYTIPDPAALPQYKRDVARARQLLAEAGYPNGLTISLTVGPSPTYVTMAELIQGYLQEAGINVEIVRKESAAWVQDFWDVNHETLLMGFQSTVDPDELLYRVFHSQSAASWTNVNSPELDALLEKGRSTMDANQRQQIYRDIQKLIVEEAFLVTLFASPGSNIVAKPYVKGLWPMDKTLSNAAQFREVWLDK